MAFDISPQILIVQSHIDQVKKPTVVTGHVLNKKINYTLTTHSSNLITFTTCSFKK